MFFVRVLNYFFKKNGQITFQKWFFDVFYSYPLFRSTVRGGTTNERGVRTDMLKYLAKRIGRSILTLFVIVTLVFCLLECR